MNQVYRPLPKFTEADARRFWVKVDCNGVNDCWPWKASKQDGGRGLFRVGSNLYKAPRIAYALTRGHDPRRKDVCHTCDNPECCNPKHLWCGTRAANCHDRDKKGRQVSPPGEQHGIVILKERQVRQILKSDESGVSLALRFGVSQSTISAIRHGRLWKHLHA